MPSDADVGFLAASVATIATTKLSSKTSHRPGLKWWRAGTRTRMRAHLRLDLPAMHALARCSKKLARCMPSAYGHAMKIYTPSVAKMIKWSRRVSSTVCTNGQALIKGPSDESFSSRSPRARETASLQQSKGPCTNQSDEQPLQQCTCSEMPHMV